MPELPEVETVRRGLMPSIEGRRILKVTVGRPDLRFPFPEHFADRLAGRRLIALGRRAKYLLGDLDDGAVLIMHLGMSGSFRLGGGPDALGGEAFHHPRGKDGAHDHVRFHFEDGIEVVYNDPRRFGFMTLGERADLEAHPLLRHLGPEPTGNALSAEALAAVLEGRRSSLKAALLDQSVIAGLGNIYVCESLHRAGLSPFREAGSVVTAKGRPSAGLVKLTTAIREVIGEAIEAGGSTLRDHRLTDGSLGYFQHRFAVYDRAGDPCPRVTCDGVVERAVQTGRATFHCPRCQR